MAERFVKTMKEDYIAFMPKPDVRSALRYLSAFSALNETTLARRDGSHCRSQNGGAAAVIVN
jgi:putative transposase